MLKNILVLSYPQGAAGKLLGSTLMSSKSISHWNEQVELDKNNKKCLDYVRQSFTKNMSKWMLFEPNHTQAWNLQFISAKYARGEDLTTEQIIKLANKHATAHFHRSVFENKLCMFPWHKTHDNIFASCKKITVLIDTASQRWFDQALWEKHFLVENDKVKMLEHDTALAPHNKMHKKHINPLYSELSVNNTYKNEIVNNPDKQKFKSVSQFRNRKHNICVNLSDLLDETQFIQTIERITQYHKLEPVNQSFARSCHQHWSSCHAF